MQIKVNYDGQFKINKKLRKKIEIKILDNRTQGKNLTKKNLRCFTVHVNSEDHKLIQFFLV
jgi:hypothetical protein